MSIIEDIINTFDGKYDLSNFELYCNADTAKKLEDEIKESKIENSFKIVTNDCFKDKIYVIPTCVKPITLIFEDKRIITKEEPNGSITIISPLPENAEIVFEDDDTND